MKLFLSFVLVVVPVLLISGCGTASMSGRPTGYGASVPFFDQTGYEEKQLSDGIYQVRATGNRATDRGRVNDIVLRRAAELTLENGYPYFLVVNSRYMKEVQQLMRSGVPIGPSSDTGAVVTELTIKFAESEAAKEDPENAGYPLVDAQETLTRLTEKFDAEEVVK